MEEFERVLMPRFNAQIFDALMGNRLKELRDEFEVFYRDIQVSFSKDQDEPLRRNRDDELRYRKWSNEDFDASLEYFLEYAGAIEDLLKRELQEMTDSGEQFKFKQLARFLEYYGHHASILRMDIEDRQEGWEKIKQFRLKVDKMREEHFSEDRPEPEPEPEPTT